MNRGEPNDFYSRSCDLSGHEWGQHEAGTRCIWCGTYQLYLTNAIKAERTALLTKLRDEVEGMEHRYPIDIFPELTETDKENLKVVHEMFPNLIGRVDASACRRFSRIEKREIFDLLTEIEDELQ